MTMTGHTGAATGTAERGRQVPDWVLGLVTAATVVLAGPWFGLWWTEALSNPHSRPPVQTLALMMVGAIPFIVAGIAAACRARRGPRAAWFAGALAALVAALVCWSVAVLAMVWLLARWDGSM